jgi:hypothetical protein
VTDIVTPARYRKPTERIRERGFARLVDPPVLPHRMTPAATSRSPSADPSPWMPLRRWNAAAAARRRRQPLRRTPGQSDLRIVQRSDSCFRSGRGRSGSRELASPQATNQKRWWPTPLPARASLVRRHRVAVDAACSDAVCRPVRKPASASAGLSLSDLDAEATATTVIQKAGACSTTRRELTTGRPRGVLMSAE